MSVTTSGMRNGFPEWLSVTEGAVLARAGTESSRPACPCRKVREEYVADLREQLQIRNRAEEQLRAMMARLERTNAELAASLCTKALPPTLPPEPPKKVRGWARIRGTR